MVLVIKSIHKVSNTSSYLSLALCFFFHGLIVWLISVLAVFTIFQPRIIKRCFVIVVNRPSFHQMNENQNWCQEEREVIRTGNSQKDILWENMCLFMNSEKYCGIIRICGAQYSWNSWVTFIHEFTSSTKQSEVNILLNTNEKEGMVCNSPYTCSINKQSSKYINNSVSNQIIAPLFWSHS